MGKGEKIGPRAGHVGCYRRRAGTSKGCHSTYLMDVNRLKALKIEKNILNKTAPHVYGKTYTLHRARFE